jgi:hypothetical protein
VGPRAGLDDIEKRKFLTLPGLELRPLGRYTDCATPAHRYEKCDLSINDLHMKALMSYYALRCV